MRRRDFIIGGVAAGLASGALGQSGSSQGPGENTADQAKLNRMAVMTYCFEDIIKSVGHPDDPARTLDVLDCPQMIADRYGIHHVTFQHYHFAENSPAYFREVRDRMRAAHSKINQICLEFDELNISSPERYVLLETIDLSKTWIDYAAFLGASSVLINQGTLAPEVRDSAIATLKTIGEYGKSKKVDVNVENRGEWRVLVEVIKAAGVYATPDIGNFRDNTERMAGLRVMYTMTSGNSHAHYNPERYNEADAINVAKQVGYKGLFSIETGRNNGPDPYAAVVTVRNALLQIIYRQRCSR